MSPNFIILRNIKITHSSLKYVKGGVPSVWGWEMEEISFLLVQTAPSWALTRVAGKNNS